MAIPPKKKQYTDLAGVMAPLATFAGAVTLATLFIINCPDSRLQSLLALASQLLLASPLALVVVYLFLYDLSDTDEVLGMRHRLVNCQFIIIGLMMAAAFVLLGAALLVLVNNVVGAFGLVLLTLIVFFTLITGFSIFLRPPQNPQMAFRLEHGGGPLPPPRLSIFPAAVVTVLLVLEVIAVILLLGFGGDYTVDSPFQYGCNTTTLSSTPQSEHTPTTTTTIVVSVQFQETDYITLSETDINVIDVSILECEPLSSTLQGRAIAHRLSVTAPASLASTTAVVEASDGQLTVPATDPCQ
jgi:hypothetical protein